MPAVRLDSPAPMIAELPAGEGSKPSIAIVYDKFLVQGGGERVCEMLLEAFPDAKLYALNARPRAFWESKMGRTIVSPPLGSLFASRFLVSILYPLAALLMASMRVRADVVLAYSSSCGKFVRIGSARSILYSNYPNRGIFQPEAVIRSRLVRTLAKPFLAAMAVAERRAIRKYDRTISISQASRSAMRSFAGVESDVLMPPFNEQGLVEALADTSVPIDPKPYYVLVSRLEPEKDVSPIIDAFSRSRRRLTVIGTGSMFARFKASAGDSVTFLGFVDDATLARTLAHAKALVFPSAIEYSLVPLEAVFLGVPVIARDTPSMREILRERTEGDPEGNAIFYSGDAPGELAAAIARAERFHWDRAVIQRGVAGFGRQAFIDRIRSIIAATARLTTQATS